MNARGFSLVEIIVAVGVFTVVAMLTVGSLFILTSAEKRVASIQANQDNMRFSIIEMTREIRNGAQYATCGGSPATCFHVRNADGAEIEYRISDDPSECSAGATDNCILRSADGGGSFFPITGSDVKIALLNFYLFGVDDVFPIDTRQARVTIVLQGVAQEGTPNETNINLQTTISMLQIDTL